MTPSQTSPSCLSSPNAHEKAIAAFPGNKTPQSGTQVLALEEQESAAHPATCFPCVQDLTKSDNDD